MSQGSNWERIIEAVDKQAAPPATAAAPALTEEQRAALDELTALGQEMGDYDNEDIRTLLTADGKGKAAKREALTRLAGRWLRSPGGE